jgi:allophanate hydrolase subunit 2
MIIANEEVKELLVEIPEGHKHLRTTVVLHDGRSFTFQEATIANLVRAYITVKTHPQRTKVRLTGRKLEDRKEGYAEWQLVEE